MKLCKSISDMSPLNIINLPLSFIPISLFLLKVIWLSILEIDEAKHPNKIFIFRKLTHTVPNCQISYYWNRYCQF